MLSIHDAATTIGLHTLCARVSLSGLENCSLPCILHWNQNHFVILYRIKKNRKFFIADPGKGLVSYTLDEFKKHWISTEEENKGVAMFFETTPDFFTYKKEAYVTKFSLFSPQNPLCDKIQPENRHSPFIYWGCGRL